MVFGIVAYSFLCSPPCALMDELKKIFSFNVISGNKHIGLRLFVCIVLRFFVLGAFFLMFVLGKSF